MSAGFRTAPATGTGNTTFIVFGDSGTGSTQQRQLATLMSNDTFDVALHAGDIAYGSSNGTGDASYQTYNDWFFDIYAPWLPFRAFYPSEGNHDSRPSNGDGVAYLDAFTLPTNGASSSYPDHAERYYSFDYGRVHFVVLDTEFAFQDATRRAEQLSWLESDLAATPQPWKIALFHRSPYSAGGEHGSDLAVRAAFSPVFERYGVQLALSAHEHTYERTHPLARVGDRHGRHLHRLGRRRRSSVPVGTAEWTAYARVTRHHYVKAPVTECTITLSAIGLDGACLRRHHHRPVHATTATRRRSRALCVGCLASRQVGAGSGQHRRRRSARQASERWRREDHDRRSAAGQLLRRDVRRRRRHAVPAVDSRQGRQQRLGERLGVRAVRQEREREWRRAVPHRHDRRHRSEHRGLQRMRPVGMGLAGQRLGRRRPRSDDLFRQQRCPAPAHSDARRRVCPSIRSCCRRAAT